MSPHNEHTAEIASPYIYLDFYQVKLEALNRAEEKNGS